MSKPSVKLLLIICLSLLCISACGQKGPLVLPDQQSHSPID